MAQNQDFQKLAYQYQILENNFNQISEQLNYLQSSLVGIQITQSTIKEIREAEPGQEIILPIGNTAFVKAKLIENDNFLMSIGKDVLVERNGEQSLQLARKTEESLKSLQKTLTDQMEQITKQMEQIAPMLNNFVQTQQRRKQ